MSYAIVRTGGKQYRVKQGQSLLVERLPADDGAAVQLEPLLYVDGSTVIDGADLSKVRVEARIVGQERGPKLRVVKFKPKRGYKRRTGHRQELTRIEVTDITAGKAKAARQKAAETGEEKAGRAGAGTKAAGTKAAGTKAKAAKAPAKAKAAAKPKAKAASSEETADGS